MDELIEILNPDGTFSGKSILKSEAHKNGVFHPSVHVWICNMNKEILIQKRVATKSTFPNLWDISVAGHISFGENPLTSAVREINEEIGLTIPPEKLKSVGTFEHRANHPNAILDHELHYIYICKIDFQPSDLTLQKSEVAELKLIPFDHFSEITSKNYFVPHGQEYIQLVQKALKKII
jgi:isopentenyldiphosphate isomerase